MTDISWIREHLGELPLTSGDVGRRASAGREVSDKRGAAEEGIEQVSQEFESLLLGFMLKEMRATIPESGLFPASMAEDIFTDMLDQQRSANMSRNGGIGISRIVFNQLDRAK